MIYSNIEEYHLNKEDQFEVLSLAMKNLGLMDQINFFRKPSKKWS